MEPPIEIGAIFLCLMPFAASISFSWREINVGPCDYLGRRTRRTAPFRFLHAVRTEITKEGPHFLRGTDVVDAWGDTDRDTQRGHTTSSFMSAPYRQRGGALTRSANGCSGRGRFGPGRIRALVPVTIKSSVPLPRRLHGASN